MKNHNNPAAPQIEMLAVESLIPFACNSRTHSDAQVAQIAGSIREFGFTNPVLIDAEDGIIAGHGRVMAARKLAMAKVPCLRLSHLTEMQRRAYIIADNKLALNAGWDDAMLAAELAALREAGFDLNFTGFDGDEIEAFLNPPESENDADESPYTNKIIAPVYEPKGERPPVSELFDHAKSEELITGIKAAKLPEDVRQFMLLAAERHTVFNFRQIAEFYCHADKTLQDLMERSGLVIIDFDKAIECGFVHLTEKLGQLADMEESNNEG